MAFTLAGAMLRRRQSPMDDSCPIDRAMQVIGTRSAILLMREAFFGTTRFDDFSARTGFTEAVTASRLKELVGAGLLSREPYREPGQRTRYEYVLTERGSDLMPAILALGQWGVKHTWKTSGRTFRHDGCGARVRVVVECDDGHRVGVEDTVVS